MGKVGCAVEPCPFAEKKSSLPPLVFNARWQDEVVKCGDEAQMLAETQNIPSDTNATLTIQRVAGGGAIATVNCKTGAASVAGAWISQKQSDSWDGEEAKFVAAASGVQGNSEGTQLSLFKYPDIKKATRSHVRKAENRNNPAAVVHYADLKGKYTIEFTERQIIVKVRVKLVNKQGARPASTADYGTVANGPAVAAAQKNKMKKKIEKVLSQRLDVHRKGCPRGDGCNCPLDYKCCKFEILVKVFFVEAHEHHVVNLWPGSARHNAANWHVVESRPDKSWAHETGHLLGWYDEYNDGAHPPAGADPQGRWQNNRPAGIMGTGSAVFWDHLEDFRSWFVAETGENWRLIKHT